jgi:hypothetical protein
MGGMAAAAANEGLQSLLMIAFSVILIPTGLAAIGGWAELGRKVPAHFFDLFGSGGAGQFSVLGLVAILLVSVVQNAGLSHNMGICGSARDEFAARSGVSGTYLKRLMIILWAFAGLIAVALFGPGGLSDPDTAWGAMSNRLLGPGLAGLMLAGVIAGTMSTLAAKALAISSLFVRNVFRQIWPDLSEAQGVFLARCTIVAVLILGTVAGWLMRDFFSIINLVLTVNLPFGAAVLVTFFWRRVTAAAVWWWVLLTTLVVLVVPWTAAHVPGLRDHPALTVAAGAPGAVPAPVYFNQVVRARPGDPTSPLVAGPGLNRFNLEGWLLAQCGSDLAGRSRTERVTLQFLFDAAFPFLVLLGVSLVTRPTDPARVARFYGRMKTPVGATPELERAGLAETERRPDRFDHTKLWPRSNWEFCRWDRVDTLGFLGCCALSGTIVLLLVALLRWAAP